MKLTPYLHFSGNCEEAFHFYEKVLNGKITYIGYYGNSPMADRVGSDFAKKVMHITLEFDGQLLHGCDAPPDMQGQLQGITLCLEGADLAQAEKRFQSISEGGHVTMPLQKTFWSTGFGMFEDKFGVPWMINCAQPQS